MTVFYRKYRPQSFSKIIGQKHIVETLLSQLKSGKIGHGYLFAGPRGTGKTSCARIFAKAVNCQKSDIRGRKSDKSEIRNGEPCNKCDSCLAITGGFHLDLIEIDAASNRGIEEIRDLREKIKLAPVAGKYKVYIIDEAHMLTPEAFNALLKTLEEPPKHVIFVLATTEPHKLPGTIVSRCQRFDFRRITPAATMERLAQICATEGIEAEAAALHALARNAAGSLRDAENLL